MASAVPPMGSTQARPNLLGQKPHWGEYLDYDVSNDPNLNTTVLGATLSKPIFFLGFWARWVSAVHSHDSTPLRQSREQPNHLV